MAPKAMGRLACIVAAAGGVLVSCRDAPPSARSNAAPEKHDAASVVMMKPPSPPLPVAWRYQPDHLGKDGAKDIQVSACPNDTPRPPRNIKTRRLAMVPTDKDGWVSLAPVASLAKGQSFCHKGMRFKALSKESELPLTVDNQFVPDGFNARVEVKATPEASVTVAGLLLTSNVVLHVTEDGTVEADREGVGAEARQARWVSRKIDTGKIVFVPRL